VNDRVTRLGVLLVVALAWSAAVIVVGRGDQAEETPGSWQRENYYVNYANYQRAGSGPLLDAQNGAADHPDDAFRVLVVGDSYSYGYGSPDLDVRWPTQLEIELERRLGPGRVRVDLLVKPGAASIDQADWLAAYREPYDALVVGYTWNDVFPGEPVRAAWDASACPQTAGDGPGRLNEDKVGFDCTVERLQGGNLDEVPAAYAGEEGRALAEALDRIVAAADGRPVLALQLLTSQKEHDLQQASPLFARAGADEIDPRPVLDLIASAGSGPERLDLMVDPGDPHPSMVLARAYARLVADALEPLAGGRRGGPVNRPLVSNHLPHTMRTAVLDGRWRLDLYPSELETVAYHEDGTRLSPQYVPCMVIGAPHARIMFDPFTARDLTVTVTDAGQELDLWTAGYDTDGRPVSRRVGPVREGEPVAVRTGGDVSGILLAVRDAGCPTDRDVTLAALTVEIVEIVDGRPGGTTP